MSVELFNQVQEINRSRADAYNANYGACSHLPKGDNPYRERLVCADCGTQMKLYRNLSKNHKKAYFTYICPTYEEHQELRCTKKTIRSNALDAMVLKTSQVSDCAKSWMALIEQYKSAEIVSRELVTAFISEIRLSADGSIKVSFLFQDELSRIRAHCKAVESEVA